MALRIAFVGKKAAGKSFAADHLVKKQGFKRMRVDDGVVKFIRYMWAYRPHKRVTWEKRWTIYDLIYRVDPDVQVDYLLQRLDGNTKKATPTTRDVVVDDVRYINELLKLREVGFIIVRITAPATRKVRMASITKNTSAGTIKLSEYYGQNFDHYPVDYSILNDSRDATRAMIDRIVDIERAKQLVSNGENNSSKEVLIEEKIGAPDEGAN